MPEYEGRLELTWTNKGQNLLADDSGSYEWLPPSDYRVAEVRLVNDVETCGPTRVDRARDNLVIMGDALYALTSLQKHPEFKKVYAGKVRLAYIDPPFNTQRSDFHYDDALEHSVWLSMMSDRLMQIHRLLAPNGAVYVHCDAAESHYLKTLMDEIFGRENFRSEIIWKRTAAHNDAKTWGQVNDSIFFYSKSRDFVWNKTYLPHAEGYVEKKYNRQDGDGRMYMLDNLTSPNPRPNMTYEWNGFAPPSFGWRYSLETMRRLDDEGRIWYPDDKNKRPRFKRYLDESPGRLVDNLWVDIPPVNSQALEDTGYDTQKPEQLLHRIIEASTNPGDIVLDCFGGSGTTAAVAHKLGRRWVTIERNVLTTRDHLVPRLKTVVNGADKGGISKAVEWKGGGSFRILEIGSSMYEEDGGIVFLAEGLTNGHLAEATAAQLGFEYDSDPPFSGRKGRSRLAVIDGVVNEGVVKLVVVALAENERVVICGTGIDPDSRVLLREAAPGSTIRKIPAALLDRYRSLKYTQVDRGSAVSSRSEDK